MAKMKTTKHNFPEGKVVICNEKITLKNYKKLFSKCLKANIHIGELFMRKPICKDYIYFGWDGYKISRYYKDNDLPKVSIEEFNSFFNYKEQKEKTYKITKEQILKYNMKDDFPEVFETKLTVGKWYKSSNGVLKFFVTNEDAYGFNSNKEWISLNSGHDLNNIDKSRVTFNFNWKEATTQEVEEALTKEAVKRGFKEGVYFNGVDDYAYNNSRRFNCIFESFDDFNDFELQALTPEETWDTNQSNPFIFKDGVWAEIIPTLTIQEAEAKLNCKIV